MTIDWLKPTRYVGLRITGTEEAALANFKKMEWENPYFYCYHPKDAGCANDHVHFAILRDYDPTLPDASNAKTLARKYIKKTELRGNKQYAFSFHSNSMIEAGNYMKHYTEATIVFSEYEWEGLNEYAFEYQIRGKREPKPDLDVEQRRKDLDAIPLTSYNLVSTMQRYDKIHHKPKRPFKECFIDVITNTRYRLSKELSQEVRCPRELIEEYERGQREFAKSFVDRWCPY